MLALNRQTSTANINSSLASLKVFANVAANAAQRVAKRQATPVNRQALALEVSAARGETRAYVAA